MKHFTGCLKALLLILAFSFYGLAAHAQPPVWLGSGTYLYSSPITTTWVGIGTSAPISALDVTNGDINLTNGNYLMFSNIPCLHNRGSNNIFLGANAGVGITTGSKNAFLGYHAGYVTTTGSYNTFSGAYAGYANTSGGSNTFSGAYVGFGNTSGSNNTFSGHECGFLNTTGENNVFTGSRAGHDNDDGNYNTAVGSGAGYKNITGDRNVFTGYYAGFNTKGDENTFIGYLAGENSNTSNNTYIGSLAGRATSGIQNTFIGYRAGMVNNIGESNTFGGHKSGEANTDGKENTFYGAGSGEGNMSGCLNTFLGFRTGASNVGGNNTFVGHQSGEGNTGGLENTFLGAGSGVINALGNSNTFLGFRTGSNNTASNNTFVGHQSGDANAGGSGNTFYGAGSGGTNTAGSNNIAIGAAADFSTNALTNANVIGANAIAGASNTMILGGTGVVGATGSFAVNVGIGTSTPTEHLHTVNPNSETVLFSTTNSSGSSTVTVDAPLSRVKVIANGNTAAGPLLPAISGLAPAVPLANMTGLLTDLSDMAIGIQDEEDRSIHFINSVADMTGAYNATECMRINKTNGFVGVHTRSSATAALSTSQGDPQALFHVNLTNPVNANLNTLTEGIRFEGLPTAAHPDVIVIDGDGNLAKRAYPTVSPTTGAWLLTGNTTTTGSEFIGTLNNDDFRIQTNSIQRAMFTRDGNFDMGNNSLTSTTTTSTATGTGNTIDNSASALAVGIDNTINTGNYSVAFGNANLIDASSPASQATGVSNEILTSKNSFAAGAENTVDRSKEAFVGGAGNQIVLSEAVAALGGSNKITGTDESGTVGEDNEIVGGHGVFVGGGHNYSEGRYNILLGAHLRAEPLVPTPMPSTAPLPDPSIMIIGEQVHSSLHKSLTVGFYSNRTTVTTKTGMAVQLNPTTTATYNPTVNFEVQAALTPALPAPPPVPMPLTAAGVRSNIRFHNLPVAPYAMPAVVVDPTSGELFQTTTTYLKQGNNSDIDLDELYKENEELKARMTQLESMLAQICEKGCAGLNTKESDALYQSIPNPGSDNVMINYYLSRNYNEASISLYNLEGKIFNTFPLTPNKGNGFVNITVAELQPGIYMYKLVVDGKQVGTQKLQKR